MDTSQQIVLDYLLSSFTVVTAEFFLKVQRFIFLHPTQHRHMDKISLRRKFIAGSGLIKAAQSSEIMKGTASFRLSS
jgi:hypothetical protein